MTGHFKVNGVGTLWLSGDDEIMAQEVGAVMIVWELWCGTGLDRLLWKETR